MTASAGLRSIGILYFSGTGGTEAAARSIAGQAQEKGLTVGLEELSTKTYASGKKGLDQPQQRWDYLMLLFPVYAADAPAPVYEWIAGLSISPGQKIAVLSVSGGGEVWPNTGCRAECCRLLESKGFQVIYEAMLCMPCNWLVPTPDQVAMHLLAALPRKTELILNRILSGSLRRTGHRKGLLVRQLSKYEKSGSRSFARKLQINTCCTGCSLCARDCPTGNIRMISSRPLFGNECVMCFKCIYNCPVRALHSNNMMVLKQGFSLTAIRRKMGKTPLLPVEECCKGVLWAGVKAYLTDRDQL
jgi:ferredoxin